MELPRQGAQGGWSEEPDYKLYQKLDKIIEMLTKIQDCVAHKPPSFNREPNGPGGRACQHEWVVSTGGEHCAYCCKKRPFNNRFRN